VVVSAVGARFGAHFDPEALGIVTQIDVSELDVAAVGVVLGLHKAVGSGGG
jgi:hypothetical protein